MKKHVVWVKRPNSAWQHAAKLPMDEKGAALTVKTMQKIEPLNLYLILPAGIHPDVKGL